MGQTSVGGARDEDVVEDAGLLRRAGLDREDGLTGAVLLRHVHVLARHLDVEHRGWRVGVACHCELANHVTLAVESVDRLYLHLYRPRLQHVSGVWFFRVIGAPRSPRQP